MATAAQLRALRKKHGLGEFRKGSRKRRKGSRKRSGYGGVYGFNPPDQVGIGLLHRV